MRKLIVLAVVFGMASAADATVLSWSAGSLTLSINETAVVLLLANDSIDLPSPKWVGHTPASPQIASIVNIVALINAGGDAEVTQTAYDEWWTVMSIGTTPYPIFVTGPHYSVTVKGLAVGTEEFSSDYYETGGGTNDILEITVVPEPSSVLLLAIGSLGLIRKRRR